MSMRTAIILGTRPEIIKMSPIIRFLQKEKKDCLMIHTGQHYSYEMDRVFFKDLELPEPRYQLSEKAESADHQGEHTGRMMAGIERILLKERPSMVLVEGDTNSVLAGALVTCKIKGIKLGHVEAGLRSYDRAMPEEVNRILADHVSDYLFAPTAASKKILLNEGISKEKIFVTGNTIVDAVKQNLRIAQKKVNLDRWMKGKRAGFFLMTMHRMENVDRRERLALILKGLKRVWEEFKIPTIFPVHPRTLARLKHFSLKLPRGIEPIHPLGFMEFLMLEANARMILTDSGGVQEEACILRVPCVTLRTSTERPETVEVGANRIAGYEPESILRSARKMMDQTRGWKNPFGDGRAGERIVKILEKDER